MLKIPVEGGVITLKSSKLVPLECAVVSGPEETSSATKPIIEERVKIAISPEYPEQIVMIGSTLTEEGRSKNAGATYQRLVDKAFHKQIGRNLKVYVDDLVIKSRTEDEIGLKVCLEKVDAVLSLPSLKCLKDVQKLNGKLASLNRFLAKSAEKSLPFFKTLKKCTKKSDFHWTTEAEEAFKQMKQLIVELPMLTAPMEKEELIVYLAATKETVSVVLMTEREAKQMPIYFVSRALRGSKLNYTSMEKLVLALVHASKRLKRVSVKGQILADFIVERPEEDSLDTPMEEEEELPEPWILFTDGSSCMDGFGARLILTNPEGMEFTYALRFRFDSTNNEAEYEALIDRLRIAEQMGVINLQANVDSRLVANQVNGTYVAKEADMVRYLEKVKALTDGFKAFTITQIPRSKNKKADALSKIASTSFAHLSKQVLVKALKENSTSEVEVLTVIEEEGDTWMTPIYNYLKSWRFAVINGIIYKKSFLGPWLRPGESQILNSSHVLAYFPKSGLTQNQDRDPLLAIRSKNSYGTTLSVVFNIVQLSSNWKHYGIISNCELIKLKNDGLEAKTNGLVERANHSLGEGIKARLEARSKNWMEELPHVLWAHHTMIKSSNGDTPFSLTYETEVVIPAEIVMPTIRTAKVDLVQNNEALEINLDLLEERREEATIREAKSKAKMEKYYNAKVQNTSFKLGDLVY
ncbi:reverse transcriptase domain-containing protein [Tanacetum coccineum]|uniref:Reverse transcriptase domain-containing protein n=1 Tax=Tanacetum coccineum TaxID=301880 RepID=A0ABQ4XVE6_9ASTR